MRQASATPLPGFAAAVIAISAPDAILTLTTMCPYVVVSFKLSLSYCIMVHFFMTEIQFAQSPCFKKW